MPQGDDNKTPQASEVTLEGGTYEIIRNRLLTGGKELKRRLEQLNQARKDIFGSIETTLLATDRISTANNCSPRDMIALGRNKFIFGYNVRMGLKSETRLSDVFAVYEYLSEDRSFRELSTDELRSGRFEEDFKGLYKYYRETVFAKFSIIGLYLYMVFRTGKSVMDIKTFKWAIQDGQLIYIDNRSDHEFKFPPQHDFEWKRTHRDFHRTGEYPHISIDDRVFVEAVGGDITFKVEDNTESGQGIYAEPVEQLDQTLDDAEIYYALVGHIILVRIRPYLETQFRYFIFNEKTQEVNRVDAIEHACVLLPDDQGLIFSNGYYLQTGELKQFDNQLIHMVFESRVTSANGEDFLYVFYYPESGDYIQLPYNMIAQKVENPVHCHGFSCFDNGEMLIFRRTEEAAKHHAIQIWQTPFVRGEHALTEKSDAFLYKIGNSAIVRCMAECNELLRLVNKEDSYAGLYIDLVKQANDVIDAYFWIDKEEAFNLREVIRKLKDTAAGAIDEFEKVVRVKKNTAQEVKRVTGKVQEILSHIAPDRIDGIDLFVSGLAQLRTVRGEIISLKELRYIDLGVVEKLEERVTKATDKMSLACIAFLLTPDALAPYEAKVSQVDQGIESLTKVAEAKAVEEEIDTAGGELEMLIEIVSNLKIDDSTHSTRIIDNISQIYSTLNQVKAALKNKKKSLLSVEGTAQFNAQLKLLNQSVINYLDICDMPEKCDEYLTKVMIQVEELEGRFVDFDEFILKLSEKRDELYNAFENKKVNLVEARNKKANTLMSAAERLLKGIKNRIDTLKDINAINGYFAADLMIDKVRNIVEQLVAIEDTVKADDIQSRLKTIREDAVRQLKDRQELFVDGANVIQFGAHKFSVNVQPLDLTVVKKDKQQMFHLTGTNFFEPIQNETFLKTRDVWDMEVLSENRAVYRGEYLAFLLFKEYEAAKKKGDLEHLPDAAADNLDKWLEYARRFMGPRYNEGYTKGVHDQDAAKIVKALIHINSAIGFLIYHPRVRALGRLFWMLFDEGEIKDRIKNQMTGYGLMYQLFALNDFQSNYISELISLITQFAESSGVLDQNDADRAAYYLFSELTQDEQFVISHEAAQLADQFEKKIKSKRYYDKFSQVCRQLKKAPIKEYELVRDWVYGYIASLNKPELELYIDETSVLVFLKGHAQPILAKNIVDTEVAVDIEGLIGDHPVIQNGIYHLHYNLFMEKLSRYSREVVPLFETYQALKKELVDAQRKEMRLDEFKPRILSSFVRNKLINQVYLPLVGDNLAKQIGVVGEEKRTDLMGLLLLVSPPGYGKTTLMEYLANRLGIIFMKINGPAIGHQVTSLDPAEAQNASAREEILKLNLSLEMGDNVMIYLDDIQHCHPELLQKFISLCDAQRKIEGVYKGKSRTYDLRGKKVVVVMAGNPYTESGEKFKIPDMLANRADTYNLGDIIGDTEDVFKLSYLENALTSNPILGKLSSKSREDVYSIIQIADTKSRDGVEFSGSYVAEEINEMVAVMEKMLLVQDTILKVNQEYIRSAAQADEYRTEPPFKLQGSYRNMNRLAEKILPVMNQDELKSMLISHYENEAQTLTTGAEFNLLKFKEITGWMNDDEKKRWEDIKRTFKKNQLFHGTDTSDPVNRVVAQMSGFQDGLSSIQEAINSGIARVTVEKETPDKQAPEMAQLIFNEDTARRLDEFVRIFQSTSGKVIKSLKQQTMSPEEVGRMSEFNRIPKIFLTIIKKQFDLMNGWMKPTLDVSLKQSNDLKSLFEEIENLKNSYKGVIREKGNFDETIVYYNSAIEADPNDYNAYYNRSLAWYSKRDLKRALSDVKNALALNPKSKKYQKFESYLESEIAGNNK